MENQIIIKPTFDVKSIFNATIYIFLSSRLMLFIIIFIAFQLINVYLNGWNYLDSWASLFIGIAVIGMIFPFAFYQASKKHIKDNPKLKENISYTLNQDYFFEKGESYEVKYLWKEVFKVVEKNNFFLIYIRINTAKIIKKSDLKDNQYNELKALFNSLDIKKSLK